jgi:hypothetical protein
VLKATLNDIVVSVSFMDEGNWVTVRKTMLTFCIEKNEYECK